MERTGPHGVRRRWAVGLAVVTLFTASGACGSDDDEGGTSTDAPVVAPVASDPPVSTETPTEPTPVAADATDPAASSSTAGSTSTLPEVTESPADPQPEGPEPSFEGPPTFVEQLVALILTDDVESGELGAPAPAFDGGAVPADTSGGLGVLDGVAIPFEGSVDDLGQIAPDVPTWRVVNQLDRPYFENIGQLLALAVRLDKDPAECAHFCAITASNLPEAGGNSISAGLGIPIFLEGFTESAETSFVDGEVRNLFISAGDDGSVTQFANPMGSWVNVSAAGNFFVAVYPLGFADEVVVSTLDDDDPLNAYYNNVDLDLDRPTNDPLLPELVVRGVDGEFDWETATSNEVAAAFAALRDAP